MSEERTRFIQDLAGEAVPPARGILSLTPYDGEDVRLVMFGFAPGEELSEHTAAKPAIVHVLSGEGSAVVDGLDHRLAPGTWFHMPAGTAHSIRAETPLTMALYLLPG